MFNTPSYESLKTKRNLSLLCGILFTAYAIGALAFLFGVSLPIPSALFDQMITEIVLVVAGLLLLYDSIGMISLQTGRTDFGAMILGLIFAAVGAVPLLVYSGFGTIIPVNLSTVMIPQVPAGLLLLFGIYLLVMYRKLRMISYQMSMW